VEVDHLRIDASQEGSHVFVVYGGGAFKGYTEKSLPRGIANVRVVAFEKIHLVGIA